MLKLLLLLLITTVCSQKYTPKLSEHLELASEVQALEGEDLVEYINGIETTWTVSLLHFRIVVVKNLTKE